MNTRSSVLFSVLTILVALGSNLAIAESRSLEDVFKQTERATKGVKGLTAIASVVDISRGEEVRSGEGKVWISMQGKMRFEIQGDKPMTLLSTPQQLFVHDPTTKTVKQYALDKHVDQLAQYALVGFAPLGNALKKEFLVTLLAEETLDDNQVIAIELTPKNEKFRSEISKIQLWIDQANWLPVQRRIFHSASETHLTIRYKNVARDDKLKDSVFKPAWPKGTKKVKG